MADLIIKERAERSLRDVSYVLFRHKRKAIWFFAGFLFLVTLVTFTMPKTYQSNAKILVKLGRESVILDPTVTASGHVVNVSPRRESVIKDEMEILNSRDLAEKVVDSIGPEKFHQGFLHSISSFFFKPDLVKERDSAVRALMKTWRIEAQKDSNIITISYEAHNPKLAHKVVQDLLDFYLVKHLAVNRTKGSLAFFKQQADKQKEELAQTEDALEKMKNRTGISSVVEQRNILLGRIGGLQKEIVDAHTTLSASLDKTKAMQQLLKDTPKTIVTGNTKGFPNYAADGMRQKLYDLQLKEQDLLSRYTAKNFLVQQVRREIRNAKALLQKEAPTRVQVSKGVNPAYQQLVLAIVSGHSAQAALKAKAQSLETSLASARDDLKALNQSEVQLAGLQRDKQIQEANYQRYSEKLEQARIDTALDLEKISNISIAQAATSPIAPVWPQKGLILSLAIMFSGFGAVGLAYSAELFDHSLKRPEDVEKRLKAPMLAAIPHFSADKLTDESLKTTNHLLLPGVRTHCGIMSQLEECCEALCDQLIHPNNGASPPHVIAVTSSWKEEGVSTVASNLALALARKGNQRVLLVEANHLRPSAHKIFGIRVIPGLTDSLAEGGNLTSVNSLRSSNLDVIQAGKGEISLSQLADSKEFAETLSLWKSEYSFVVLDMPPIFQTNSTLRLASLADGVVLVVEAENVSHEVVRRAQNRLAQAKANVVGVVLNKRRFHIPEWVYRRI
jgi:capsular exopolysaccharide synthesis family protein